MNFKPPHEGYQQPSGADVFQAVTGLLFLTVHAFAVFWSMIVKRFGSVGTRAYLRDIGLGVCVLLAGATTPLLDRYLFRAAIVLMMCLYWYHIHTTLKSKEHVHTNCIGGSRFRGKLAYQKELIAGLVTALVFVAAGFVPFGVFIGLSAFANCIRDGMIVERDRLKSVQLADAEWEAKYLNDNYEEWKRYG